MASTCQSLVGELIFTIAAGFLLFLHYNNLTSCQETSHLKEQSFCNLSLENKIYLARLGYKQHLHYCWKRLKTRPSELAFLNYWEKRKTNNPT